MSNDNISDTALQTAGQCWCDEETVGIEMDHRLALAFARRYTEMEQRLAAAEAGKPDYRADELANAVIKQNDLFAEAQARIAELERDLAEARKDTERYRWLCADLFGEERIKRNGILCRMPVMSYSAASTEIDAAMRQEEE